VTADEYPSTPVVPLWTHTAAIWLSKALLLLGADVAGMCHWNELPLLCDTIYGRQSKHVFTEEKIPHDFSTSKHKHTFRYQITVSFSEKMEVKHIPLNISCGCISVTIRFCYQHIAKQCESFNVPVDSTHNVSYFGDNITIKYPDYTN